MFINSRGKFSLINRESSGIGPVDLLVVFYDEETIEFLQKIRWWDNDEQWFRENWELLCDIDKLKECYEAAPKPSPVERE